MGINFPANTVGIVGFGRIGGAFARRFKKATRSVIVFDPSPEAQKEAHRAGIPVAENLEELGKKSTIIFLLVPAGKIVDTVINKLKDVIAQGVIIIDAGNSNFHDSIRRYQMLKETGLNFLDCGTSGGVHGLKDGFCLMVGGEEPVYKKVCSYFKDIAYPDGYGYVGSSGAGHYVKMVHNGIEYALLQSYAEGFHVLRDGHYSNLDVGHIARLWNHGSVIRSFILELIAQTFDEVKDFGPISGKVAHSGMGQWTVDEARKYTIPVSLIEDALNIRKESQITGGNFATKLVAVLRNQFGGHKAEGCKECET